LISIIALVIPLINYYKDNKTTIKMSSSSSLVQNIDIEMKFLAVVIPFALVKLLGASYDSWFWTNGN
jgi:hypothetical protein